jgi:hypothetical protein
VWINVVIADDENNRIIDAAISNRLSESTTCLRNVSDSNLFQNELIRRNDRSSNLLMSESCVAVHMDGVITALLGPRHNFEDHR